MQAILLIDLVPSFQYPVAMVKASPAVALKTSVLKMDHMSHTRVSIDSHFALVIGSVHKSHATTAFRTLLNMVSPDLVNIGDKNLFNRLKLESTVQNYVIFALIYL